MSELVGKLWKTPALTSVILLGTGEIFENVAAVHPESLTALKPCHPVLNHSCHDCQDFILINKCKYKIHSQVHKIALKSHANLHNNIDHACTSHIIILFGEHASEKMKLCFSRLQVKVFQKKIAQLRPEIWLGNQESSFQRRYKLPKLSRFSSELLLGKVDHLPASTPHHPSKGPKCAFYLYLLLHTAAAAASSVWRKTMEAAAVSRKEGFLPPSSHLTGCRQCPILTPTPVLNQRTRIHSYFARKRGARAVGSYGLCKGNFYFAKYIGNCTSTNKLLLNPTRKFWPV